MAGCSVQERRFPPAGSPIPLVDLADAKLKRRGDAIVVADLRPCDPAKIDLTGARDLVELSLPAVAWDSNAEMIRQLPSLKKLRLFGPEADDAVVASMQNWQAPASLMLMGGSVTDVGLNRLAGTVSAVDQLSLRQTRVTGESLTPAAFEVAPWTDLELAETDFGDRGMAAIARVPRLAKLNLWLTQVTDAGVAELAGKTSLTHLNLDNCPAVTDASIDAIATLNQLEFLHLGKTSVTGARLAELAALPKLAKVHLTGLDVSDEQAAVYGQGVEVVR